MRASLSRTPSPASVNAGALQRRHVRASDRRALEQGAAREGIRAIVADVEAAYRGPRLLWKADSWDGWRATSPMKNLYVGAAGVIWGLDRLRARGYAQSSLELPRSPRA